MECVICNSGLNVVDDHCRQCREAGYLAIPMFDVVESNGAWYHFSSVEFRIGDMLTPPSMRDETSPWINRSAYRTDRVYIWAKEALVLMGMDPPRAQYLYRVRPIGPLEPDPESLLPKATPISRHAYMAVAAIVEERIDFVA